MKNVLEYLENAARIWPEKPGVIETGGTYSFSEIAKDSRCVASALTGVLEPRHPAAVFMPKGKNALTAFFGIVYAGGFYTFLDPELPKTRLRQITGVLKDPVVVTDCDHLARAREYFPDAKCLCVEELRTVCPEEERLAAIRRQQVDGDPLYVNFTSGSTGVPKGVVVSHRSVIDFIEVFAPAFGFDSEDRIANQAPFDFDVSVKDIYTALKTGAALVIVPRELFSRPAELLDYVCDRQVTAMIWAVSALCLVSMFHGLDYRCPHRVKKVLFSGEVMPQKQLKDWMDHLPDAVFVNLYGPTEITCNCTYHVVERGREYREGIPIGVPFDNEQVFLVDEEGRQVTKAGDCGEICVRGTALALGYYDNAVQTSRAFVQNPLHSLYLDPVYRTGDRGKYNERGELFFCGRKDFQIKYRGHRIELEEIERAMEAVPGVERGICVFDEGKSRLYGVYTGTVEKQVLHRELSAALPPFMIPERLVKAEHLALTKNGKADRKRLLEEIKRGQSHAGRQNH